MKFLPLLVAAVSVLTISSAFAKQDNSASKSQKSDKAVAVKTEKFKNFEKAGQGKTNAQIFTEKAESVSANLKMVAEEKKTKVMTRAEEKKPANVGNGNVSAMTMQAEEEAVEDLEKVAEEIDESSDETAIAINEVEKTNKFKKLLVGSDYKNLGQLRSSLVRNRNQIRNLTRLAENVTDESEKAAIEEQLTVLMQERERIKTVVSDNESGFSILGWVFKFLSGYDNTPIEETVEEQALEEDVAEIIGDEAPEAIEKEIVEDESETGDSETGNVPNQEGEEEVAQ